MKRLLFGSLLLLTFAVMVGCDSKDTEKITTKNYTGTMAEAAQEMKKNRERLEKEGYISDYYDIECPINITAFAYDKIDSMKFQIKLADETKRNYEKDEKLQWLYASPDENGPKRVNQFEPLVDFNYVSQDSRKMRTSRWKKITLTYNRYDCGYSVFPKE